MNNRQRAMAVLKYEQADRLPVVHFGYWHETLQKWKREGHLTEQEAREWGDGKPADMTICKKLGFDFDWYNCFHPSTSLDPCFERKVLEELPDGSRKVMNHSGMIELEKDGVGSIPAEIDHTLKSREIWEDEYLPRLEYREERVTAARVNVNGVMKRYDEGGLDFLRDVEQRDVPVGLYCGSLMGQIRNWLGVTGLSYLAMDDEDLFEEIVRVHAELAYQCVEKTLSDGAHFDFAHFWEDICFKNGPLVIPAMFAEVVGPYYKKSTQLVNDHGIDIVSLDCDGKIDSLIPIWLENGVNTMFPIEVGTWRASIAPWREQYGRELRGVGGTDKTVFSRDRAAVDAEIERLKPLVELGGYIPCPDHRIAPDAEWDNVRYYCERMHEAFGH